MRIMSRFWLVIALWLTCPSDLIWAQGFTASILGTVTDNTGARVPSADVTVTNLGTQQKTALVSDETGNYTAPLLPPGNYSVSVEMPGFKRIVREPITLQVDQRQRLDFVLEIGEATESVTVSAQTEQVQLENATVGAAVTTQETSELPLNGRLSLQLDLLLPGAQSTVKGHLAGEGGSIFVHGLREDSNYFWLDGMDNTSQAVGEYVVNMPQFSISEFRVMSPTYDAEFGRTAGAQINVLTRSGSNAYHGDIYELMRNSALDAKNFFDPPGPIPTFRRHQFGADAGGRLVRDKTFFYGAWEGLRVAQGESASNTVPTPQEIQGNFSDLGTTIRDPLTGQPFPGNIIPANRINAIGAAVASYYPAPNGPNGLLKVSPTGTLHDDVAFLKLDQVVSAKNRLTGRIAFEDINANQPIAQFGGVTNIPGMGLIEDAQHDYTAGISDVHTFTPTLLAEFRLGWNRYEYNYVQGDYTNDFDGRTGLGAPLTQTKPVDWGMPTIQMAGVYSPLGSQNPEHGPFNTWFFAPTITWIKAKHNLKMGGDLHRFDTNFLISAAARGVFSFSGQYSGNPLSDLLLGYPAFAAVGSLTTGNRQFLFVSKEVAGFIQDDWHVTPKFTTTLGLRYEYTFPATEKRNLMSNFVPSTGQVVIAGQNGQGSALYNADCCEIQPRVGFSWDLFGNGKWALRGGYGVFNELTLINQVLGMWINYPMFKLYSVIGDGKNITLNNVFQNAQATIPQLSAWPQNYKNGRVQQYSFGVQHEVAANTVVDLSFVGTHGTHLYGSLDLNAVQPGPGDVQSRRPYPQFSNISCTCPFATSNYYGLDARVERRFSNGWQFASSFTWAHAMDDYSGSATNAELMNNLNPMQDWGPSIFDVRTRLTFSSLYELPIGRGKRFLSTMNKAEQAVLGGWQLNSILTLHSGNPFNVLLPFDNSNTGENTDRPDAIGDPYKSTPTCQTRTPECFVNPAAFATPAPYTYGNAGRNSLVGPGFENLDMGLSKTFYIGEDKKVVFRSEVFNLLNHPAFDNPGTTGTTDTLGPSFGQIYEAGGGGVGLYGSRQLQFGLRIVF